MNSSRAAGRPAGICIYISSRLPAINLLAGAAEVGSPFRLIDCSCSSLLPAAPGGSRGRPEVGGGEEFSEGPHPSGRPLECAAADPSLRLVNKCPVQSSPVRSGPAPTELLWGQSDNNGRQWRNYLARFVCLRSVERNSQVAGGGKSLSRLAPPTNKRRPLVAPGPRPAPPV